MCLPIEVWLRILLNLSCISMDLDIQFSIYHSQKSGRTYILQFTSLEVLTHWRGSSLHEATAPPPTEEPKRPQRLAICAMEIIYPVAHCSYTWVFFDWLMRGSNINFTLWKLIQRHPTPSRSWLVRACVTLSKSVPSGAPKRCSSQPAIAFNMEEETLREFKRWWWNNHNNSSMDKNHGHDCDDDSDMQLPLWKTNVLTV